MAFKKANNCGWIHTCFIFANSLRVCSSFRKSFLLPTRMMGTFGQKCFTSGVHFSGTISHNHQLLPDGCHDCRDKKKDHAVRILGPWYSISQKKAAMSYRRN